MGDSKNYAGASERRLSFVACMAYAVGIFSSWTIPVQIDALIERFSMSAPHAGSLATGQMMMLTIAAFFAPSAGRRLSATQLGSIGCLLSALGFALVGVSPGSEIWLWLGFSLCGVGQGVAGAAGSALAATSRHPDRRFAEVAAGSSAYSAIWLFAIPQLRPLVPSFEITFWACAFATAVCGILVAVVGSTLPAPMQSNGVSGHTALRRKSLGLLMGTFMVYAAAQALWSFADQFGARLTMGRTQIGGMLFASTIAGVIAPLAAPLLAAKSSDRVALNILIALTAGACAFGSTTHLVPLFIACVIAQAFTQMALVPLLFSVAVRLSGDGSVAPLVYGTILFGCSVGPLLGGIAFEPTGRTLAGACIVLCGLSWRLLSASSQTIAGSATGFKGT